MLCVDVNAHVMQWLCIHTEIFLKLQKSSTNQSEHNSIVTTLSIAKFTSESNIGDQAMLHCPWSNIGDQSIFHRGSMNFEILSSVTLVIYPLLKKKLFYHSKAAGLAGRHVAVIGSSFRKSSYSLGLKNTQFSIT